MEILDKRGFFVLSLAVLVIILSSSASAQENKTLGVDCIDTDGGSNIYTPGMTYSPRYPTLKDYCGDRMGYEDTDNIITEQYCVGGESMFVVAECKKGYVCKEEVEFDNPYVEGYVEWLRQYKDRAGTRYWDYHNDTEKERIKARYREEQTHAAACVPKVNEEQTDPTQVTQKVAPEFPTFGIISVIMLSLLGFFVVRKISNPKNKPFLTLFFSN